MLGNTANQDQDVIILSLLKLGFLNKISNDSIINGYLEDEVFKIFNIKN